MQFNDGCKRLLYDAFDVLELAPGSGEAAAGSGWRCSSLGIGWRGLVWAGEPGAGLPDALY
ncbi:MAG: hypothetical protein PHD54_14570 [Desulfuromonadaceae bacterium]|nr:hypothetical protein [Desulfuromonadaceae bacterium]